MRENKKAPSGLGEFFRHLCLQTRLTLWICSIVLLSVSVTAALGTNRMIRNKEEEIRDPVIQCGGYCGPESHRHQRPAMD